jgi:hypothetical protein
MLLNILKEEIMSKGAKREGRVLKGSSEKSDENLRGQVRELTKEVERWKRYSAYLEKQLTHTPEQLQQIKLDKKKKKEEKIEVPKEGDKCQNCGGTDTVKKPLWTPTGDRIILNCNSCEHKEKI